jgi:hypothetical protein
MSKPTKPLAQVLPPGERARVHVHVEEIEWDECHYCATLMDRSRRATHCVRITGWVSFLAVSGTTAVCLEHAEQMAQALRAEVKDYRKKVPASPSPGPGKETK